MNGLWQVCHGEAGNDIHQCHILHDDDDDGDDDDDEDDT